MTAEFTKAKDEINKYNKIVTVLYKIYNIN